MAAIDTNVLVRFLVHDDPAQSAVATERVRRSAAAGELPFLPITVVLELEWALRSRYGFAKADIGRTIAHLLCTNELSFQSEPALEFALLLWRRGLADFSDCIHVALATEADEQPLWTFDKAASGIAGAELLK